MAESDRAVFRALDLANEMERKAFELFMEEKTKTPSYERLARRVGTTPEMVREWALGGHWSAVKRAHEVEKKLFRERALVQVRENKQEHLDNLRRVSEELKRRNKEKALSNFSMDELMTYVKLTQATVAIQDQLYKQLGLDKEPLFLESIDDSIPLPELPAREAV